MADILTLPGNIQKAFVYAAVEMLDSMDAEMLIVELAPAPEQRHSGHMIRVAVAHNVLWYRELCASHIRNVDKNLVRGALRRMINIKVGKRKEYDCLIFGTVENYLVDVIQDEDVINYIETGIPF